MKILSLIQNEDHMKTLQVASGDSEFMPWLSPGALDEAVAWMSEQLSARGMKVESCIEHVKSSFVGVILRVRTNLCRVYFKFLPTVFCRDAEIIQALSSWRPQFIQIPIAADIERRWMLTREVSGIPLSEIDSLDTWKQVLRVYAGMQKDSICPDGGLERSPLFDWRINVIADGIDPMLDELEWLQEGYDDALDKKELQSLRSRSLRLKEMCLEVNSYAVPCALEHGDLHPGNVIITDDGPVFLDWAWSSISHPFLSLCLILHENKVPETIYSSISYLRQAYLKEWTYYESENRLMELSNLMHRWQYVQYAVVDAEWVRSYLTRLNGRAVVPNSYLEWALRQRQYYLIKTLRRILNSKFSC